LVLSRLIGVNSFSNHSVEGKSSKGSHGGNHGGLQVTSSEGINEELGSWGEVGAGCWLGGPWGTWLGHTVSRRLLRGGGELKELAWLLSEGPPQWIEIEGKVSCSALSSTSLSGGVQLAAETLLVESSLSEDTEALSGTNLGRAELDLTGGQGTESTDVFGSIERDVNVLTWELWLLGALLWELLDHGLNLGVEETVLALSSVAEALNTSLNLVYPSLVIETLNEVLDVGNLLVIGGGLLLPFTESHVVSHTGSGNSLNFALNDGSPHILVVLSEGGSLLETDIRWVLGDIVDELTKLTLWVVVLLGNVLWLGDELWIVGELKIELDIWTISLPLNVVKTELAVELWGHAGDLNTWETTLGLDQPMAGICGTYEVLYCHLDWNGEFVFKKDISWSTGGLFGRTGSEGHVGGLEVERGSLVLLVRGDD